MHRMKKEKKRKKGIFVMWNRFTDAMSLNQI